MTNDHHNTCLSQSNNPPIPTSSYYYLGSYLGASFLGYSFFFSYLTGAEVWAGPDDNESNSLILYLNFLLK